MPKTNSPATSKNLKKNVALSEHVSFLHAIISKTAGQLKRKTFLLKSIVYSDSHSFYLMSFSCFRIPPRIPHIFGRLLGAVTVSQSSYLSRITCLCAVSFVFSFRLHSFPKLFRSAPFCPIPSSKVVPLIYNRFFG